MDSAKFNQSLAVVSEDVSYIDKMLSDVVREYTQDVDVVMTAIRDNVLGAEGAPIYTIEKYYLELSNCLYFVSEKCERLGIFNSISKAKAQETYNNAYLEHQHSNDGVVGAKKPTVAESQATAETASIYDKTVNDMYDRAYKVVKNKISAAETMVSTLSKLYSSRMQESQASQSMTGRQILNEGNVKTVLL